jgi:hypothetical protein
MGLVNPNNGYNNQAPPMYDPLQNQQPVVSKVKIGNHLYNPDPAINDYNEKGFLLIPAVVPQNLNLKEMIGEFIYSYVEKFTGEAMAGKITGMLLDLPHEEIKKFLYDFTYLYQKIGEAVNILKAAQLV